MANLTGGRGRGQILLVAALALGVTFVALALILNSAIFTENLASRGQTTGGEDVVEYRDDLRRGVGTVVTAENENATDSDSHSDVRNRVRRAIGDVNGVVTRHRARIGVTTNVSWTSGTDGTRIFQSNETRNFTNVDGDATWTAVESVDATRAFELNVSRSVLSSSCTLLTDCFNVSVTDGSSYWNVSMKETASGVEVNIEGGGSCGPIDEDFVTVDLTAGTVNGTNCPDLSWGDAPTSSGYDIVFNNGDETAGTYSLVVRDTTVSATDYDSGAGDPSITDALYAVTVAVDYESPDVTVDTTLRVAPGEPDG